MQKLEEPVLTWLSQAVYFCSRSFRLWLMVTKGGRGFGSGLPRAGAVVTAGLLGAHPQHCPCGRLCAEPGASASACPTAHVLGRALGPWGQGAGWDGAASPGCPAAMLGAAMGRWDSRTVSLGADALLPPCRSPCCGPWT